MPILICAEQTPADARSLRLAATIFAGLSVIFTAVSALWLVTPARFITYVDAVGFAWMGLATGLCSCLLWAWLFRCVTNVQLPPPSPT